MSIAILMNIEFSFSDALLPFLLCRRQGEGAALLDRSYASLMVYRQFATAT